MIDALPGCPEPPDWQLDWPALSIEYPWLETLRDCQQDSINHGEGDVWTHTRMVCEEMVNLEGWRSLSSEEREIVFFAALFHDIAKPMCRREELDGHISFRGHARRGAILTRKLLWQRQVPFLLREQITALVRSHLVPFFLIEREDSQRLTLATAQTTRCDHLALLLRLMLVVESVRICSDCSITLLCSSNNARSIIAYRRPLNSPLTMLASSTFSVTVPRQTMCPLKTFAVRLS